MKSMFNKLMGRRKQEKNPVDAAPAANTEISNNNPEMRVNITQVIDDEAIQSYIGQYKTEGEILVSSVSKNGEYEYDIAGKPPVLKTLHVLTLKTLALCESVVKFAKVPYTIARTELAAKLNLQTTEERKDCFLKQNSEAISRDVSEAEKPLLEVNAKQQQKTGARNKKEEAEAKCDKISKEQYGGFPPLTRIISKWLYGIIMCFIAPIETMLNSGALDSIESDLQAGFILPTAMTITAMIAAMAHFIGFFVGTKSHKWLVAVISGAALMMLGIVFFLRLNGMESAFVLTFINVAAFLLLTCLSYVHYKDDAYFRADEAFVKWRDLESKLQQEIDTVEKSVKDEVSRVYDRWNAHADKAVEDEEKPMKLGILRLDREQGYFDNYLKTHVHEPINALYNDFTTRANINFIKARKKNSLPIIVPEPEEGAEKELIETLQVEAEPGEELKVQMNGRYNGNGFGRFDNLQKGFYALLFVLGLFGFTSCSDENAPPQFTDVVVMGDASISPSDSMALPSPEQQLSYVLDWIDFAPYDDNLSVARDRIRVRVTHIGNTSFPPVQTVELPLESRSPGSMVKSKRRKVQQSFIEQLRSALSEHTLPKGLPSSHVFDCFCHVLPPLVASDADTKLVFIVGDLLELSETENFYTLPTRMPGEFQTIVDRLENRCPALKGITLSNIHFVAAYLPDVREDKFTYHSRDFWQMYVESKGGAIEFLPTLPEIKHTHIVSH